LTKLINMWWFTSTVENQSTKYSGPRVHKADSPPTKGNQYKTWLTFVISFTTLNGSLMLMLRSANRAVWTDR